MTIWGNGTMITKTGVFAPISFFLNPEFACMQTSELVSMAEAMVNLTALKRHISAEEESVGGPIDVALISKGEGFIWIKKKNIYDPRINRDLNQNYFRGSKNENI